MSWKPSCGDTPRDLDEFREDIRVVFERDDHLCAVGFEGDARSVG